MVSRLVKKSSLIAACTLGTIIASGGSVGADPYLADQAKLFVSITPESVPPSLLTGVTPTIIKNDTDDAALFNPMSDAAAQGMGCLVATTSSLALAYTLGPTELMMLVTGAVIVPSSSSLLFITLGGIMGAGSCGVGAALTPSFLWAKENAKGISAEITAGIKTTLKPKLGALGKNDNTKHETASTLRPMTEDEIQGVGCLVGVLGLGAIAMATAPTEAVMLAAGGVGVPSSTPLLMMGMLGTLLPAGCSLGAAASLPLVALYQNFDSVAIGQKLASLIGWSAPSVALHDVTGAKHESSDSSPLLQREESKLKVSRSPVTVSNVAANP